MATVAEPITAPIETHSEKWQPSLQGWLARLLVLTIIFGGVIWVTAVVPQFWADRIALAVIYAIIGLSLNIVLGYVGQVSLGHHGFVGIAAFVAAYYVTEQAGCAIETSCAVGSFATGLFFAVISGGAAAALLGLVALRIRGLYLALITLAYGFMAERSIFEIPELTRGGAGMPAPRPTGFTTDRAYAFLCMAFLALVIFVDWRLLKSKVGRAVLALKHSEPVASSYGINVTAYKILAFILSGLFAGLGGGLLAFHAQNVVSNNFNFANAVIWVLMVVVGGLGNRTGVVLGSAFFALFPFLFELSHTLEEFMADTVKRSAVEVFLVIGPALALLTIILHPGGIAEQVSPITRWLGGKRFSLHPEGHGKAKGGGSGHGGLLAKLGLHGGSSSEASEAPSEEIRYDESPTLAGQTEEPAGISEPGPGASGSQGEEPKKEGF